MLAPPPVHSVVIVAAWFTDIICMAQFNSLMQSAANAEALAAPISHTNLTYLKKMNSAFQNVRQHRQRGRKMRTGPMWCFSAHCAHRSFPCVMWTLCLLVRHHGSHRSTPTVSERYSVLAQGRLC